MTDFYHLGIDATLLGLESGEIHPHETLMHACEQGDMDLLKILIDSEHDVRKLIEEWNAKESPSNTQKSQLSPLHVATMKDHYDIVSALLKHNCNPNLISPCGNSPLLIALLHGKRSSAEVLLRHNAEINTFNPGNSSLYKRGSNRFRSPVYLATRLGQVELLELMLQTETPSPDVFYSLMKVAIDAGYNSGVKMLLKYGPDTWESWSPLRDAGNKGCTCIIRTFLNHFNKIPSLLMSEALYSAANGGHYGVVETLLQHGANPNEFVDKSCETAIHKAAKYGHRHVVEALLSHKANPSARSSTNITPLFHAVKDPAVAKCLLERKADIHAICKETGDSALHDAVRRRVCGIEGIQLLLNFHADPLIKNHNGETPRDIAKDQYKPLLKQHERRLLMVLLEKNVPIFASVDVHNIICHFVDDFT